MAPKLISDLISLLTIWGWSCVESFLVLLVEGVLRSPGKTLLAFALLHSVLQGPNLPVTPGISWLPTFAFQSPLIKGHLFWVLVLKGLVGLHRTIQLQLFHVTGWGIDLDYCDIEWFALETNRDHFVIFEIASNYCISDSFVDHAYFVTMLI